MKVSATIVSTLSMWLSIGALPTAENAEQQTLIRDVRVWDGRSDNLSAPGSVLIVGNRVAEIRSGSRDDVDGARIIDGGGRGLIDAHTHLAMVRGLPDLRNNYDWMYIAAVAGEEAHRMLLRGFTAVRDIGGPTVGLARAVDEGRLPGPRIYSSGALISQTSGHLDVRNPNQTHPGMTGDLHTMDRLVVEGNPLEDIRLLEDPGANLALIMKDGKIYKNALESGSVPAVR